MERRLLFQERILSLFREKDKKRWKKKKREEMMEQDARKDI